MTTERYRLSFTTGGLFTKEAPVIAECYLALRDWKQTRDRVRSENLLQVRTAAASLRISKELVARLELLEPSELESLLSTNQRDRGYLLWTATCRRYAFIRAFAIEILRESYLSRRHQITFSDYDSFYNAKALWHSELDEIALSTQQKLRQNLFRMLREADLVSDQQIIQPALVSPVTAQLLARRGLDELLVFPASDSEIQRWLR
ncbi:BrxA family protein [Paraburkholderia terrae]